MPLFRDCRAHLPDFAALNRQWIEHYFSLEPADRKVLDRPASLLEQSGHILTLVLDQQVVGCCALLKNGAASYELAKMAVRPDYRGRGLSHQLMEAAIAWAVELGASQLDLLTNSQLIPAIGLYEKHGFVRQPQNCHGDYARCDVIMRKLLTR